MTTTIDRIVTRATRGLVDLPEPPPPASQLEEARQLRDHLGLAIACSVASLQAGVAIDLDDAEAIHRLLDDCIRAAEAMNAT